MRLPKVALEWLERVLGTNCQIGEAAGDHPSRGD